jgi:hypothetical protein
MNNKKMLVIYRNSDILRNIKLTRLLPNTYELKAGGTRKLKVEYENNICEHRYSKTVLPFLNIRALIWSNPLGFAVINAFAFIKVREYSKTVL